MECKMYEISSGSEDELNYKKTWEDEVIEIPDESPANLFNKVDIAPKIGRTPVQRKRNSSVLSPVASPLKGAKKRGRGRGSKSVTVSKPRGRGRGKGQDASNNGLDFPVLDIITPPIRGRRGRGRGASSIGLDLPLPDILNSDILPPPIRGRRGKGTRGRGASNIGLDLPASDILNSDILPPPIRGKRGRGRGASNTVSDILPPPRGRGRKKKTCSVFEILNASRDIDWNDSIFGLSRSVTDLLNPPTRGTCDRVLRRGSTTHSSDADVVYSVGNTSEYPDDLENQPLFGNKKENKVNKESATIDLTEPLEIDNEELSVKVLWNFKEVFKFNIRKHQKITQIFDFFVKEKGVSRDRLLFMYKNNEKDYILKPDDTPNSFDYNFVKFIEGGTVNNPVTHSKNDTPLRKGFFVKFQCQNNKKPFESSIGNDEKLHIAMVKCAEHLEIAISNLVFEFDGDTITGNKTPKDLDMESGDCIDVKIVKCK